MDGNGSEEIVQKYSKHMTGCGAEYEVKHEDPQ